MRILVFNWRDLAHPDAGGAEVYTHEIARQWVLKGHEVTLFGQSVPGFPERDAKDGVKIVRRGGRHSVYSEARHFYKREAVGKVDLVVDEVNTRPFGCHEWVHDAPSVALIHQLAREIWFYELNKAIALLGRYVFEPLWLRRYRNAPVITVSESSRASLFEHGLRNVTVVPEGLTMPAYTNPQGRADTPTLLFCGRLAANKRPDHALEAFARATEELPDARLDFIGTGPLLEKLQAQDVQNAHFHGRVSHGEKLRLMSRANSLLATSVREGWGLVVSEAASLGTPTIGYDVAGLRDSVAASNGVLVEPSPLHMAEAIVECVPQWIKEPPRIQAGGVEDWSTVADRFLEAVETLGIQLPPLVVDLTESSDHSESDAHRIAQKAKP